MVSLRLGTYRPQWGGLLKRLCLAGRGLLIAKPEFRQTQVTRFCALLDTRRQAVRHGDGRAELVSCGSIHGQGRLRRDDLRTSSCRWPGLRMGSHWACET